MQSAARHSHTDHQSFQWQKVLKRFPRGLERDAVLGVVLGGLGVVPLKFTIVHKYTA